MRSPPDVLVAGAGPAGLALALQVHAHGGRVRIVDRRPEAFRPSRALIVHPRTLEVLRPLGVTQALLARADVAPEIRLHLGSREARIQLAGLALPDTAFPHLSLLRQMDVEMVLSQALARRGVPVERGTELAGVGDGAAGVILGTSLAIPFIQAPVDAVLVMGHPQFRDETRETNEQRRVEQALPAEDDVSPAAHDAQPEPDHKDTRPPRRGGVHDGLAVHPG